MPGKNMTWNDHRKRRRTICTLCRAHTDITPWKSSKGGDKRNPPCHYVWRGSEAGVIIEDDPQTHKRWDIENCLFHQLKAHCHLDHCFGGRPARHYRLIYLQMVAFNLWQLYLFRYLRKYDQKKDP